MLKGRGKSSPFWTIKLYFGGERLVNRSMSDFYVGVCPTTTTERGQIYFLLFLTSVLGTIYLEEGHERNITDRIG